MKTKLSIALLLLVLVASYYLEPVYQFYAHRGALPMLPWGTVSIDGYAPAEQKITNQQYAQRAKLALEALKQHRNKINSPGITAAVAIDGELVWTAAAGWANLTHKIPMTQTSQMRIGSTSKALTSVGLARLVAQQKITLDTPLEALYQQLPNTNWKAITPRHLASHMSGIPHYGQNTDYLGLLKMMTLDKQFEDVDQAVALFDTTALLFSPGEQFDYSSLGTVLLSAAMQQAAKLSYQSWMEQSVFQPLNMQHTSTERAAEQTGQLASFYWRSPGEPTTFREWRKIDLSHRLAGGGWISTSQDLALLGQGFMDSQFIPKKVRDEFWSPQKLNSGEVNPQNYAIGWRKHQLALKNGVGEVDYYHHGGVSKGAQSFLMVIPKYSFSLAVNINTNTQEFSDFSVIAGKISRLFAQSIHSDTTQKRPPNDE